MVWQGTLAVALAAIATTSIGLRFELVGCLYVAFATPELCRVDVAEHRLPNPLVLPGLAFSAIGVTFGWLGAGRVSFVAPVSALVVAAFFGLLAVARGMGMGDVKLAVVLALTGGAISAIAVVGTVALGFLTAGAFALLRALTRGGSGDIAFGPYLLGAFWVSLAGSGLVG